MEDRLSALKEYLESIKEKRVWVPFFLYLSVKQKTKSLKIFLFISILNSDRHNSIWRAGEVKKGSLKSYATEVLQKKQSRGLPTRKFKNFKIFCQKFF